MIELTKKQQKYKEGIEWFISDKYFREGRTTLLAHCYLEEAIKNPNKFIVFKFAPIIKANLDELKNVIKSIFEEKDGQLEFFEHGIEYKLNKNKEKLENFTKYCEQHPEERFYQALSNWSNSLIFKAKKEIDKTPELKDTFYED